MGRKRKADRTARAAIAQIGHAELFPEKPATPCARALALLGIREIGQPAIALFDGRATYWQIKDWKLGRRGMPPWAVELLRDRLAALGATFKAAQADLQPGPGMGWNKNATRGLGEWRAKKNLEKD